MLIIYVLILSILIQLTTAFLALRLIEDTGKQLSWMFIAAAMVLQAVRRILTLIGLFSGELIASQVSTSEWIGLVLSIFMMIGVLTIGPFFRIKERSEAERKQAEETIHESKNYLENLINYANAPIIVWDTEYRITKFNRAFERLTGRNFDEVVGRKIDILFPEKTREESLNYIFQTSQGDRWETVEIDIQNTDGTIKTVLWNSASIYDYENKKIIATIAQGNDITKRKETEEVFFENEQRLSSIYNTVGDVIFQIAVEGENKYRFVSVNDEFTRVTGLNKDQIVGMLVSDIIPEPSLTMVLDNYKKAIREKKIVRWEENSNYPTGQLIGEVCVSPLYNEKNQCTFLIGAVHDITERKLGEAELVKAKENAELSENRLFSIIENTEAGYFFMDNNGFFQNVNRAWLNLYKYENFEEVIGKHFAEVQQIDDLKSAEQFVEGIRNEDPAFMNGNFSRLCKDKTVGYHSFSARPVYLNNTIIGIEGFIIDTTKQKEAEIELLTSKERAEKNENKFRSLFTSLQEGVYLHEIIYDNQGKAINYRIIEANPISEKYLDISRKDAIGKLATELFGTSEAPFLDVYAKVAETGEPVSFEQYFEPMGKYFLISVFSPKKGEFATAFLDITKNKNYEIELLSAKEKAEESDQLKTAFLHNISHEIRTPINAIVGFSGFLNNPNLEPEKREHYTEIIIRSSNQLLTIISDIMNIATIEAGQERIIEKEFDLDTTLEQLYKQFLLNAKKQNIDLNLVPFAQLNENVILTDETKLVQILTNIIGNAIKFTKVGHVDFGYSIKNNELEFFVADTGIGIPDKLYEEIFIRFWQVESRDTRCFGGSGLGLSISKAYVELLGGKIWLNSELDKGSTFYFTIPYKKAKKETTSEKQIANDIESKTKQTINLLVAEDEESNFMLLKELLSGLNFNIIWAKNGLEAVEICKSKKDIDIILMDIKMPEMDGYEAITLIRKYMPDLPIVALTAYVTDEDKNRAYVCGCNDFISKPFKKDLLVTIIKEQLHK